MIGENEEQFWSRDAGPFYTFFFVQNTKKENKKYTHGLYSLHEKSRQAVPPSDSVIYLPRTLFCLLRTPKEGSFSNSPQIY